MTFLLDSNVIQSPEFIFSKNNSEFVSDEVFRKVETFNAKAFTKRKMLL